ncbi:hypothetical protein F1516_30755, partial [Klebsiella michiganensis]|nr:hypothetical protein [Klebsiella michiganensis]
TREENVQAVFDLKAGYTLGLADVEILKRVARIALAAMDSEPVTWSNGCDKSAPAALRYLAENERPSGGSSKFNTEHLYQLAREIELMAEESLYRHAQPAQISALKLPPKLSNDRESSPELNTGVDIWNRCIDDVAKINGEMIIAGRVDGLHPTTAALVNDFATALAEKLRKAELKYGYSNAWTNNGWMTECLADFHRHIAKGDPRDVAAYCAFMWYHGWKTEIAQPAPVVPDDVLVALQKVARIRLDLNDFDGDRRGIADCLGDAEEALIEVVNRRAATLAAASQEVK